MSGRFRMNEGDWVCAEAQCGNVNFARRTSCNRCGKEKTECSKKKKLGTEIGKVAAEKSRGLFSADDWQCSKCGNVNWARRQQCNMCNAPKYGEVEERTGYGGGYNERENVEYIEREESDGEYDEFGRKKKKFRGAGEGSSDGNEGNCSAKPDPPKSPLVKVVQRAEQADEEEEEDDDEDGDLSKYDLSGWGDDDDSSLATKAKKEENSCSSSSSRSRSRSGSRSRSPKSSRKRRRDSDSRSRSRSSSSDSRSRSSSKRFLARERTPSSRSGSKDRSRSSSGERKQR